MTYLVLAAMFKQERYGGRPCAPHFLVNNAIGAFARRGAA
ncbi:hypothetical protein EDWATA_01276 [Edwardsiella tarda ATCC 23685]|uniref:Uncharacterized protein n=1 Tax=Edwardsiella tarda ATCC 23685 TaxID=500638 RepID=D4F3G6_EDWTA|nr:hypothetical protein EDWATA_01276 [Edwardsiella tarda ATCC 23685]